MDDAEALVQGRTTAIAVLTTAINEGPAAGWALYLERVKEMTRDMDGDSERALVVMSGGIYNLCQNMVAFAAAAGNESQQQVLQDIARIIAQKDAGI